jgi:hypothetical protein
MRLLVVVGVLAGCGHSTSVASDAPPALLDAPTNDGAGPGGGLLTDLRFAVVGDTRPANLDDTANYPTPIVSAIWADVEAEVPHPLFAVSTGDYMFASTAGSQQGPQLDAYLGARATFHGVAYAAMGNHECNGFTSSNCGPGGNDGEPANYLLFLSKLVAPIGELRPYYLERFAAWDGAVDVHVRRPARARRRQRTRRRSEHHDPREASAHAADRRPHAHLSPHAGAAADHRRQRRRAADQQHELRLRDRRAQPGRHAGGHLAGLPDARDRRSIHGDARWHESLASR